MPETRFSPARHPSLCQTSPLAAKYPSEQSPRCLPGVCANRHRRVRAANSRGFATSRWVSQTLWNGTPWPVLKRRATSLMGPKKPEVDGSTHRPWHGNPAKRGVPCEFASQTLAAGPLSCRGVCGSCVTLGARRSEHVRTSIAHPGRPVLLGSAHPSRPRLGPAGDAGRSSCLSPAAR